MPGKTFGVVAACLLLACSSGSSEEAPPDDRVGESGADVCSSATLTASPSSPVAPNATVHLTSSASCNGPAQYQFTWQINPSSSGTIQAYSSSNTVDTIEMWFNKATNMIETAYPVYP